MSNEFSAVSKAYKSFTFLVGTILLLLTTASVNAGSTGYTWTHGDWSSRIAWEARYALSQQANGSSSIPYPPSGTPSYWYGDWNYTNGDIYALARASDEAFGVVGGTGGPDSQGHFRGGWCTFFVRLILYRSTYWAGYNEHLTMPGYPTSSVYSGENTGSPYYMVQNSGNYSTVQPGWVLISNASQHAAIAESRATVNGQVGWWVIDANWVGPYNGYVIGKHFMSDSTLYNGGYWGWKANWTTGN